MVSYKMAAIGLCMLYGMGSVSPVMSRTNEGGNNVRKLQQAYIPVEEIRFSKIAFFEEETRLLYEGNLPLLKDDFPISNQSLWLRETQAVSVMTPEDIVVRYPGESAESLAVILAELGIPEGPPQPIPNPAFAGTNSYWREFNYVLEMQKRRLECGEALSSLFWDVPEIWKDFTLNDAQIAVHDEYPGYWQSEIIKGLFGSNEKGFTGFKDEFEVDFDIMPERACVEFIDGPVLLAEINTWAVATVSQYNFNAKWFAGRLRPEEMSFHILNDRFDPVEVNTTDYQTLKDGLVNGLGLTRTDKAPAFTAYKEGSPKHPSWPAMHSAASNISLWLAVILNLTLEQQAELRKIDYAVSFARTVAGVHYMKDNIDGLNFGQKVIARELPGFFQQVLGADPDVVKAKIQQVIFNWYDYDHTDDSDINTIADCPPAPQVQ